MRRPLLLAHRGARLCAPENTFAAFDAALAHGCDGFEFDVRRTADGRSVVCHDPSFRRLKIVTHSYAEIIGRDASGQLCSLEDVLEQYGDRAFLNIELKDPGLEDLVIAALRKHPPQRGYVVSSFLPEVIRAIRDTKIPVGLICDHGAQLEQWNLLPITHVMARRNLVSRELVEQLRAAGRKVFVWNVNSQREMLRLAEWGVDALISDNSELLCRTLAGH